MLRTYRVWESCYVRLVATRQMRSRCVRAESTRDAAIKVASGMGPGTHELMAAPAPLSFPCAVHAFTLVVEPVKVVRDGRLLRA